MPKQNTEQPRNAGSLPEQQFYRMNR